MDVVIPFRDLRLRETLDLIAEQFEFILDKNSWLFTVADIGLTGTILRYEGIERRYLGVDALVPIYENDRDANCHYRKSTFSNYVRLGSGLMVPKSVAMRAALPFREYELPTFIRCYFGFG